MGQRAATAPPCSSVLGEPVFVIDTSADCVTVVVAVALLFPVFGSVGLPLTLAVFDSVPDVAVTEATIVTVAEAPFASVPTEQVTVPFFCEQLPCVELAEVNDSPDGRGSLTVTPVAWAGPPFVTLTV